MCLCCLVFVFFVVLCLLVPDLLLILFFVAREGEPIFFVHLSFSSLSISISFSSSFYSLLEEMTTLVIIHFLLSSLAVFRGCLEEDPLALSFVVVASRYFECMPSLFCVSKKSYWESRSSYSALESSLSLIDFPIK